MFKTFFLSEIKSVLKQPMVYIFFGLMTLLVFAAVSSDSIQIGGSIGNVFKNAPSVITMFSITMSLIGLLIAAAFFNNAALKDYNSNFNEILFSTPLSKPGYFFGRFTGALIMATVPVLGVFFGVLLGTWLAPVFGWVDADRFGPFFIETFINNYFLFILPNVFFAGTIIYALANKWKSTTISFVGVLVIILAYVISGTFLSDIDNETIAALSDSFGIRAYGVESKYFTPIEKNTLSPSFSGLLLINRVIWVVAGAIILTFSYLGFSFKEKNKKTKIQKENTNENETNFSRPTLHSVYNKKTDWLQFKSFFITNFLSITKSVTFKILFIFSAILLISNLVGGFESFGLKSYPLTYKMIDSISGNTFMFIIIILVFFSGELIWRDRESKINEVIDSTTYTSAIALFAKALSLVAVTSVLYVFFVLISVCYQLILGYTDIELHLYFLEFIYSDLPMVIVWSGIMILIQVLINNKYVAYFVSILVVFVSSMIWSALDISSKMLYIGSTPSIRYSDMNGFGPGLTSTIWFNIYWVLFAILMLQIAGVFWNRGTQTSIKERFILAKKQLPKNYKILLMSTVGLWLMVASFVFYNTQILNSYQSSDDQEEMMVDYEKKYKKYENAVLPKVTDAKYFIDIFPSKRDVEVRAVLQLTNESQYPIDSIHYNLNDDWDTDILIPGAGLVYDDKEIGYQIYQLEKRLLPEQIIEIEIRNNYTTQGFENGRGNTSIVENGTFFNNFSILPSMGYNSSYEISDKHTRKKHDLPKKERMAELEHDCQGHCMSNYLSDGKSDFINVETVISTSADQIAVAPGSLLEKWEKNGRNYYHYKVDHPSQNFFSFISARFEVAVRKWEGVDIEIYYEKKHSVNIEMMLDAVERSLEYYTYNFGPYYHKQCRIIEFPRYSTFAQAFPGTMPYSESFGFIYNLEDETENNVIDAVIAHEMAHQWWAHQVVGADMQGGTMMSESFAEYSSLMTMKNMTDNPMKMRKFLKYDHDRYLRGRSGEVEKERPLYKVENQQYIHYGKGSIILYALQDYIGEDNVNMAMRNFLEEFKYTKPPYPTSYDFLKHLEPEVPDSLKYLITDWFKEITLYDNRVKEANYIKLENGKYQVTMDIESSKIKADTIGNETIVRINDWVDIGVFKDEDEEHLLYQKRVKFDQPKMSFTFVVDTIPARAAVDPRHLLIDRIFSDNTKTIKEK